MAILVGRLRASLDLDCVPYASCKTGFGLNVCVLNESGIELSLDHYVGFLQGRIHITAQNTTPNENISLAMFVNPRSMVCKSLIDRLNGGQFFPRDRELSELKLFQNF